MVRGVEERRVGGGSRRDKRRIRSRNVTKSINEGKKIHRNFVGKCPLNFPLELYI